MPNIYWRGWRDGDLSKGKDEEQSNSNWVDENGDICDAPGPFDNAFFTGEGQSQYPNEGEIWVSSAIINAEFWGGTINASISIEIGTNAAIASCGFFGHAVSEGQIGGLGGSGLFFDDLTVNGGSVTAATIDKLTLNAPLFSGEELNTVSDELHANSDDVSGLQIDGADVYANVDLVIDDRETGQDLSGSTITVAEGKRCLVHKKTTGHGLLADENTSFAGDGAGQSWGIEGGIAGESAGGADPNYPAIGDVVAGVVYGDIDQYTGTYAPTYAAAANVRNGTDRGDGVIGTLVLPAEADVRGGVVFDGDTVGTLVVPAALNVRLGIAVGDSVGLLVVPAAGDVRSGVDVDGSYGTLVVPSAGNVRSAVVFDDGTLGTLIVPSSADVRADTEFDNATIGTLAVPGASDVRSGTAIDAGEGSLVIPSPQDVREGVVFDDGTVGTLVPMPEPESPAQCVTQIVMLEASGAPTAGLHLQYRIAGTNGTAGYSLPRTWRTSGGSNDAGLLSIMVLKGTKYEFRRERGASVEVEIGTDDTQQLPEILGNEPVEA